MCCSGWTPVRETLDMRCCAGMKKSQNCSHAGSSRSPTTPRPPKNTKNSSSTSQPSLRSSSPPKMAIEAIFYGKNISAMVKLGRAQGICIAAAVFKGLSFCEYPPRIVKQAVTGYGNASKEQVGLAASKMVGRDTLYQQAPHDVTDAIAIALCHGQQMNRRAFEPSAKKSKG